MWRVTRKLDVLSGMGDTAVVAVMVRWTEVDYIMLDGRAVSCLDNNTFVVDGTGETFFISHGG